MTQVLTSASPHSELAATGGPGVLALDLGSTGVRGAIRIYGSSMSIPLNASGLIPDSLISLRETGQKMDFPGLMERIGEDTAMTFGAQTEKPHIHLRNLLGALRIPMDVWWGPLSALGVVVSGFSNDLQRSLIQKAARTAGWPQCSLVNKTTTLAVHALRRNLPGQYLSLALGYAGAEASVVQWEGNQLRALSYTMEANLGGGIWDQLFLRVLAEAAAFRTGKRLPVELYDRKDWLLLRGQMEVVRHRLDVFSAVTWPLPADLCEGAALDFSIAREQRESLLAQSVELIGGLVANCCRDAGLDQARLQGCVASGGVLRQRPLRMSLSEALASVPVKIYASDAQALGACQLLTQELKPDSQTAAVQESTVAFRLPAVQRTEPTPSAAPVQRDTLSTIIEKVRTLAWIFAPSFL